MRTERAPDYDAIVIGAGAAGMMAAAVAGQRGLRVLLIEHADRLAEKIRISGGGRCNFTNTGVTHQQYLSRNPNFCRSALAAYTPRDFIDLVERHGIGWHEKHLGQLFCDDSSEDIIGLLKAECDAGRVAWRMPCSVQEVARGEDGVYRLQTTQGPVRAPRLVLATGGMAIPQLGATDFSLKIARQFGLKIVEPRPALVPLLFDGQQWQPFAALSGIALQARVSVPGMAFLEDMLLTHRGLSGPAILQISSYWEPGEAIAVDLAPGCDLTQALLQEKKTGGRQQLGTVLSAILPRRLAEGWLASCAAAAPAFSGKPAAVRGAAGMADKPSAAADREHVRAAPADAGSSRLADLPDSLLRSLGEQLQQWSLTPSGTAGYKKAEVMRGGVDTRGIDQKTMQARTVPGLFVIGEALDVTGWLGGYNFQWAWSSGVACGRAL